MEDPTLFPRDVQRAVARKSPNLNRNGIFQYIIIDYMGGREFESANLDRAARRMSSLGRGVLVIDSVKVYHPHYPEDKSERIKFWFLGHPKDKSCAGGFAADQLRPPGRREARLSKPTHIDAAFGLSKSLSGSPCNVWWAIDIERPWFLSRKKRPLLGILRYL